MAKQRNHQPNRQAAQERTDLLDTLRAEWRRERPELDTRAMGVVGRLLVLGETLRKRANDVLSPFDIGYTDLDVLATLRRSGEPFRLRPADLLRTVLIQSGSLTACLDRLERRGFLRRTITPGDRRSRSVELTASGLDLIDRAIEARFAEAEEFAAALDEEERRSLETLLRKLALHHQPRKDTP